MHKEKAVQHIVKLPQGSEIEDLVKKTIVEFGIPPHLRGYKYIVEIIIMMIQDNADIYPSLYPSIAQKFYTTANRVESAISNAIKVSWSWGGDNMLRGYFLHNSDQPSNIEFIKLLYKLIYKGIVGIE